MSSAKSAELMDIKASAAHSIGLTNSKPALDLSGPRPVERPRWRWNQRAKQWMVLFQGHTWFIAQGEENHVWWLADIHRLNLFPQLTRKLQ